MTPLADTSAAPRPLSRADWLSAALDLCLTQGIEAVEITALARHLGVSRGSFYWHFENRGALLEALLAEWRLRNTGVMLEALDGAATLEAGVLALFAVWADHSRFDPALDQAVRDWARKAPDLQAQIEREDASRTEAIAAFFRRQGFEPVEAFIRARIIYFTQVSYYALAVEEPMAERMRYLPAYVTCFTGRTLSEAGAATFRQIIEGTNP